MGKTVKYRTPFRAVIIFNTLLFFFIITVCLLTFSKQALSIPIVGNLPAGYIITALLILGLLLLIYLLLTKPIRVSFDRYGATQFCLLKRNAKHIPWEFIVFVCAVQTGLCNYGSICLCISERFLTQEEALNMAKGRFPKDMITVIPTEAVINDLRDYYKKPIIGIDLPF